MCLQDNSFLPPPTTFTPGTLLKKILGPSVSPDNTSAFEKQHILLKSHSGKNATVVSPFELFSGILFPNGQRKLGRKWGENVGVEEHPVLHKYPGVLSDGCSALNRRGLMLAKAKVIHSQKLEKMEIMIY